MQVCERENLLFDSSDSSDRTLSELEAFKALLTVWLTLLDEQNGSYLVRFVSRSLERLPVSNSLRFDVRSWLSDKNYPIQTGTASISDLRRITTLFYVISCELLGKNKAERLLGKAIGRLCTDKPARRDLLARLI